MHAIKQPMNDRPASTPRGRWALFAYGFRPFFLAAGLAGLLLVPWWAASLAWGLALGTSRPANLWHGHEMLFGFIVAAVAGFLLTAVPSWTGARRFAGWPLAMLTALWMLGRVAVASSARWPAWLVATLPSQPRHSSSRAFRVPCTCGAA